MSSGSSKGVFLDVDSSIVEKNLCFATNPNEEEFNKIFQPPGEEYPSKIVKPYPGFCVKSHEIGSGRKFFVNICHTESIPSPEDISERELREILECEEMSSYRVPMSIGEVRAEKDRKQEEAGVCDIAINPKFLEKIENSSLFKNFFMSIVFEALNEKHGVICNDEKIILQNRKAFGNLQVHRIQQREIREKMGNSRGIIEELKGNSDEVKSKPKIETLSSVEHGVKVPEYRIFRRKNQMNCLIGEFRFPDIVSSKELTLDLGEDRILIESTSKNYLLDIFIPHCVRQSTCSSSFNKTTKILTVKMPLVGG